MSYLLYICRIAWAAAAPCFFCCGVLAIDDSIADPCSDRVDYWLPLCNIVAILTQLDRGWKKLAVLFEELVPARATIFLLRKIAPWLIFNSRNGNIDAQPTA